MTNALDTEIRRLMGQLWEQAPLPPTADELRGRQLRGHRRRVRGATRAALAVGAALAAAVMITASVMPQLGDRSATEVATRGPSTSAGAELPDVRLDDLVVSHIPAGFTLQDNQTENIPASLVEADGPVPGSRIMTPQGSSGTSRTQRFNRGDSQARTGVAVIYVRASFTPGHRTTLFELSESVRNPVETNVHGKPAVLGLPSEGASGLVELRWVESPHVVVAITARGAVDESEVRAMAEGVTFAGGNSGSTATRSTDASSLRPGADPSASVSGDSPTAGTPAAPANSVTSSGGGTAPGSSGVIGPVNGELWGPPAAVFAAGAEAVTLRAAGYCWSTDGHGRCSSGPGAGESMRVRAGGRLTVTFKTSEALRDVTASVMTGVPPEQRFLQVESATSATILLDLPPGSYKLAVNGRWVQGGSATYILTLAVGA